MKPGVRLSGGAFRGRVLEVPPGARPTEGRVREALFSIWGGRVEGARVLDLFAGSGAVALEALGRGALAAIAVDQGVAAVRTIEANAALLKETLLEVRRLPLPGGVAGLVEEGAGPFDLVFADPPYSFEAWEELLAGTAPLLDPEGEITAEHAGRRALPLTAGPLVRTDTRRYGESALSFYRLGPE